MTVGLLARSRPAFGVQIGVRDKLDAFHFIWGFVSTTSGVYIYAPVHV